jgi:predicted TIM-barrel fold metal-dependent hydrolase
VDVHCHVIGHEDMLSPMVRNAFAILNPWPDELQLPYPEFLIAQMDKAGVDHAVLQAYDMKEESDVFTDISCPVPLNRDGIANTLKLVRQMNMVDKTMFGTDFPVMPQSWFTETVRDADFTDFEEAKIMGANALNFFGRRDLLPQA